MHAANPPRRHIRRLLLAAGAVAILALVFVAYLRPGFVFDLANRFVLCF